MDKILSEYAVYVSTYKKYNDGNLNGEWVDLEKFSNYDEFIEHCKKIHSDEIEPEFMFQDWELPNGIKPTENADENFFEKLFEFLKLDEEDRKIVEMYVEAVECNILYVEVSDALDRFQGTASSGAEFAERIAEECCEIPKDFPDWIIIDWESTWENNLRHDYDIAVDENGEIYFFLNR